MFGIKLSTLSILLGLLVVLPNVYGLLKPAEAAAKARKFPRDMTAGVFLMLLGTAWFVFNVSQESLSDFTRLKSIFYMLFAAVGIGSCVFVRDFLAVRGLAVVMLLLAKLMVDTARWVDTEWRLVIITWGYVLVVAGMWFTISPWRLRNLIDKATANEKLVRTLSAVRLAFGVLVLVLGLTVFRAAEQKAQLNASGPVAARVS